MWSLKSALVVLLFVAAAALPAAAADLTTQKITDRGVTVDVTPQNLSAGASTWDFKVVLDTHSQDLGDDLTKSAVLLDGTGARHSPVAWDGAGPGGHHREGVLRFKPVTPRPAAIELRITRPGEQAPRSFRWELK
jgi:hypothetical protein